MSAVHELTSTAPVTEQAAFPAGRRPLRRVGTALALLALCVGLAASCALYGYLVFLLLLVAGL